MGGEKRTRSKNRINLSLGLGKSQKCKSRNTESIVEQIAQSSTSTLRLEETKQFGAQSTSPQADAENPWVGTMSFSTYGFVPTGDKDRTQFRYKTSVQKFQEALKSRESLSNDLEIPNFETFEDDPIPTLQQQIKGMLNARQRTMKNSHLWSKGKMMMEKMFTAMSPLAKNLLMIGKEATEISGANPFGLFCSGLFLLITIADKELTKRKEIVKKLDYLSRQVESLEIIERLPDAGVKKDQLINRAMDVLSASMDFLSAHIIEARIGILGSVISVFFTGKTDYVSVEKDLKAAVKEFNSSLVHFGQGVGFKVFDLLQEGVIAEGHVGVESPTSMEARFIVPYQRNQKFTGRQNLLASIRSMLCKETPRHWNHRIALHGLGGVGKTQLALEYVHSHKELYDRVYWVSAVNECTLLSGYQEIAIKARWIPQNASLAPKDLMALVLKKLSERENWLLVFDNLDKAEGLDGFLPAVSPEKHMLITTRNQHYHQIPAEGLEVGVLDLDDATELLLTRSNVEPMPTAKKEAVQIVKELGCLPLAVEQAAAYIRETLKDIFQYLKSYRKRQKSHHERASKANRNYYEESIATTWNLSFKQLTRDASDLLRIIAFLNPDGILTDFLAAGSEGHGSLSVLGDSDRMFDALSDLERFSLIRRQDDLVSGQLITVHRLVQSVVKDNIPAELFSETRSNVFKLCVNGFPSGDFQHNPTLLKCRRFYDQVVMPLSSTEDEEYPTLGCLLHRLGGFLAVDGKFREAVDILERAKKSMSKSLGYKNSRTLKVTSNLAWAYYESGRLFDSVDVAEKLLGVHMDIYGVEHEATLSIMGGLAGLYCGQGRYETAAEMQMDVVTRSKKILGLDHRDTLRAIEALSLINVLQGLWDEAAQLQESVLESRRRVFGEDSLLTYTAMTNLAGIYQYQGQYEVARQLTESTFEARVKLLGEHPWTFWTQMSLGTVWAECGRFSDSLEMLKCASDGLLRTLGVAHPMTSIAEANLGYAYSDQGMYDESIRLLQEVIATSIRISGDEHFYTLWMKDCLSEVYSRYGKREMAISLLTQVVEARTRILGEDHSITKSNARRLNLWQKDSPTDHPRLETEASSVKEIIESEDWLDRPLRLRNTGVWLTFSIKTINKWEEVQDNTAI